MAFILLVGSAVLVTAMLTKTEISAEVHISPGNQESRHENFEKRQDGTHKKKKKKRKGIRKLFCCCK